MIEVHDIMPLNFLKKSRFIGSYKGMKFVLRKQTRQIPDPDAAPAEDEVPMKEITYLEGITWPQPLCFEKADPDGMEHASFTFDDVGIETAVEWLNSQYAAKYKH